ncbi:MAG: RNA polymerase sigma factor [Actinobacteria bacterium]|nr:RNA polymerase sigma factor [Actinomycetota bacterium]
MAIGEPFDDVLVAAQAGAAWATERLYKELAPAVLGYLRVQGASEPEDLTSEVFLAAFSRLGSFRGPEGRFRSWVFTIAHHRLVDDRRRMSRRPAMAGAGLPDDVTGLEGGDVEDDALHRLGAERVRRMCEVLVPGQRDVLLLRMVAAMTVEQVAAALGRTPGAVKALQRRGVQALCRQMDREGVSL